MEKFVRIKILFILDFFFCSEKNNKLKFNQYTKLEKMYSISYADLECLVKKTSWWANNPQKSSAIKIREHIPCGYLMSTIWGFKHIKNKYTLYR